MVCCGVLGLFGLEGTKTFLFIWLSESFWGSGGFDEGAGGFVEAAGVLLPFPVGEVGHEFGDFFFWEILEVEAFV